MDRKFLRGGMRSKATNLTEFLLKTGQDDQIPRVGMRNLIRY